MTAPVVFPVYYITDTADEVVEDIVPVTAYGAYPPSFPAYVGVEGINAEVDAFTPTRAEFPRPSGADNQGRNIDYDEHGDMGLVNDNPYSVYGPVSPNSVENFELLGQVINNPRQAEYGTGPVSHLDYMEYTAQMVAAQMAPEVLADQVLAEILSGGGF